MQFLKKIRIPLIILILLVLVVLSIIIVRNILTVAGRADEALDFANEMPTNLDDIFTGDFLDEDLIIEDEVDAEEKLFTDGSVSNEVVESELEVLPETVVVGKNDDETSESVVATTEVNTTITTIEKVPDSTTTLVSPLEKEVKISKLIVDKYTASRKSPSYMTIVLNAASNVEYASVKVFARRLAKNNEILSRELVFGLPKVYIVNGQGQTQFYFAGRYANSNKYIRDGRYIMYVEVIGYDKDGNRVSGTGQYPMPKFDNVITLNN